MTRKPPEFIYFDMGNVLITFDELRAFRQIAEVAQLDGGAEMDVARVREIIATGGLQRQYEEGRISSSEYYEAFCRESETSPDPRAFEHAGSDMFDLNTPIVPLVVHLFGAGYRLGVLSNTCQSHWDFLYGRIRLLRIYFEQVVLSYEVGTMKPADAIFESAIEAAAVPADRIFFVDDRIENVEAGRRLGLDAVQFTDAPSLAAELRSRGVRTNY